MLHDKSLFQSSNTYRHLKVIFWLFEKDFLLNKNDKILLR